MPEFGETVRKDMSFSNELIEHKAIQHQHPNINNSDEDDQQVERHPIHEDAAKMENEDRMKQVPDSPILCPRIMEIINSVHKKPVLYFLAATPDYTRISHHRTCQQTSCRFLRFSNQEPPKGPFFISFKKKSGYICFFFNRKVIETNHYDEMCVMSFFDQTFSNPRCIGKGSFGEVFKAFSKDDKRCYAIKISVEPFRSPADREDKLREVQKHELLPKHPNLISYVRAWEEYGFLYIQTELCQCSLLDYKMKVGIIPEKDLWFFFGDIALAVRYLHSHELLHLDIKPQNIMVSFDGICKLGDFSLIVDIKKKSKAEEGDGKYLAPEVLQSGAHKPSDIFSLGMTMIDICTDLELPTTGDLWQGFRKLHAIVDVPPDLLNVVLLLLETDPRKRLTAEQICSSPMLAKCIHKRQYNYLKRNVWWILLTIGYSCLFATSWIVQPVRSTMMHAATYLKRMSIFRRRCSTFRHIFKATSDESPMFKNGYVPQVDDASRLALKFEEDDEDYKYDDTESESGNKLEASQSEDELTNVLETSVREEPHSDEIEENSKIDADTLSPSSLESVHEFERNDLVGDTKGSTNFPEKEDRFGSQFDEIKPIIALDDDDELPSTSGSISGKPKSPCETSPLRDGYTTPPSNTTPSPFVCKTPARGRFDDLAEQRMRHLFWWKEALRSPSRKTHQEAVEASSNDTSPEAPYEKQLSGLEEELTQFDFIRRRAYFHMRELSPPAKRVQIGDEEGTDDSEDQIDDSQVKKSGGDAE
uniref:non-specific serine/threonine protein kinase n=1 Tax=Elaeophora elaphi TaxID=1147741 RepID=A0A158Q883_9BILA